jgi:hypothetical protein
MSDEQFQTVLKELRDMHHTMYALLIFTGIQFGSLMVSKYMF